MWAVLEAVGLICAAAGAAVYLEEHHPNFYKTWVADNFAKLPWVDRV